MRRFQSLLLTLILIPMVIGGLSYQVRALTDCPNAPATRLAIGMRADVTATPADQSPSPLRVRDQASAKGKQIKALNDGDSFNVIGGPTCADGYEWWQIKIDDGTTGWVAEGNETSYFIEPTQATATPVSTVPMVATPILSGPQGRISYFTFDKSTNLVQLRISNADGSGVVTPLSSWLYSYGGSQAIWSPNGHQLVVIQNSGMQQAVLLNRDGSIVQSPHGLTPAWSPDSQHFFVVQSGNTSGPSQTALLIYRPPDADPIRWYDSTRVIDQSYWLPDSEHILLVTDSNHVQGFISLLDVRNGKITDVLTGKVEATGKQLDIGVGFWSTDPPVAISPDGSTIAFEITRCSPNCSNQTLNLYMMHLNGGSPTLIAKDADLYDGWSPDGKYFSYSIEAPTNSKYSKYDRLVRVIAKGDGSAPQILSISGVPVRGQTIETVWAPDSRALMVINIISQEPPTTYFAPPDGTRLTPLTLPDTINYGYPAAWAPDSQHILFKGQHSDAAQTTSYFTVAPDGSQPHSIDLGLSSHVTDVRWSPDSQFIAFTTQPTQLSKSPDKAGVFTYEIKTGKVTTVSNDSVYGLIWVH